MRSRSREQFTTIRTEGGLLPVDLLQQLISGDGDLDGIEPIHYHLAAGERFNEVITRSWNRLDRAWETFREREKELPEDDIGTSLTRERWLLILFQELGYGRLQPAKAKEIEDKSYPISHFWENSPIHLVGFRIDLDERTAGVAGAARTSPHGLVQEYLNRSDAHLWGFVSNGRRLRILRDNMSLTRQAYVEFDLESMMDDGIYADFVLLWLLCHQSRVEGDVPEECWLERWSQEAQQQGVRALEQLREGVEQAIETLGAGFIQHPANADLRDALATGDLSTDDYYRELLRLVYRLLFLFVAEDRGLLLHPDADSKAIALFNKFYSTGRLRRMAQVRRGGRYADLYTGLKVVMSHLGSDEWCPELGLPALGSFLWSSEGLVHLHNCDLANRDFLEALRALAFTRQEKLLWPVNFRHLGSQELGSVYESLLEMHPVINPDERSFNLGTEAGHERKTTGSYYTPPSLVQTLLDSALDPVLKETAQKPDAEKKLLDLKICDQACGSGHFLIEAAHRIAKR